MRINDPYQASITRHQQYLRPGGIRDTQDLIMSHKSLFSCGMYSYLDGAIYQAHLWGQHTQVAFCCLLLSPPSVVCYWVKLRGLVPTMTFWSLWGPFLILHALTGPYNMAILLLLMLGPHYVLQMSQQYPDCPVTIGLWNTSKENKKGCFVTL